MIKKIQQMYRNFIVNEYRKISQTEPIIGTKEIRVKKGKRRYTLFFVKDEQQQWKFNLGRI
jgi:hypothetical protein